MQEKQAAIEWVNSGVVVMQEKQAALEWVNSGLLSEIHVILLGFRYGSQTILLIIIEIHSFNFLVVVFGLLVSKWRVPTF
uniref:Transmembrane protein n=1 Tax=Manihot esculenta TaxID=3983 RepID=A0A2C9UX91_MANES